MLSDHVVKSWRAIALAMGVCAGAVAHEHPLGNITLRWKADPHIKRVAAMNIDFQGGDYFVTWRAPGRVEKIDGRDCLVGGYFFFDVDDRWAFDLDETVVLTLTVDRSRTDGFNVSYDQAVNPTAKRVVLGRDYTERFERIEVLLERARFANRKYEHMDFAIGALGAMQPQPKGVNGELAICDLQLSRPQPAQRAAAPAGRLKLSIRDERGERVAARVGLYRDDGWSPLPSPQALPLVPYQATLRQWPLLNLPRNWPGDARQVFYVDGAYEAAVPAGEYTLVVSRGPEYRLDRRRIVVPAGAVRTEDVKLARWTDMPAQGWYAADGHIHLARPTPADNARTLAYTSAEDIHVSNLLQVSSPGQRVSYPQYAFGRAGDYVRDQHALVSGQESPRSSHRGHTIGLNAPRYVWTDDGYFVYDRIAEEIDASGGLFGYAHVAIDAFNVRYGLATDIPLGHVAFLEILQMGFLNTGYYYDFLNLGFRLLPSAGSDYPFIRTAGAERMYAKVGTAFSPAAWFDAWEQRRSFVTSGPMLEFTVNGDGDSNEVALKRGEPLRVRALARVNPDMDLITKLELIVAGEVVATLTAPAGAESLTLEHEIRPLDSGWMALRAYGAAGTAAHTAPVYLIVDGERRTWSRAAAAEIAARYLATLDEFKGSAPNLDEDWERAETEHSTDWKWRRDKARLDASIERAAAEYRRLIDAAR